MRLGWLLLLLALALLAAFAALNWAAFTATSSLWLGFVSVQAPLGAILLFVIALLCVAFGGWIAYLQGSVLLETRRQAKELQSQRDLADRAEASRFVELRSYLATEMQRLAQTVGDSAEATSARLADTEARLARRIDDSANGIAASLGELEDRLERRGDVPRLPG